jgi:glycosyltransferase involved in cell wall biosynthesis
MIRLRKQPTSQRFLVTVTNGLRSLLKRALDRLSPAPESLLDFNEFCANESTRRALVSYLVSPLLPPSHKRDRTVFSNSGIAQQIPQVLNELGYVVDIIQYDLKEWQLSKKYDLFVGHGGVNFEEIIHRLPKDTVRIYFSTGIYWKEWNIREAKRLYDLTLRRGHLLDPDRSIQHSEESANRTADGIICLGNQAAVSTYHDFPLVIGINNATYPVTWSGWKDKDYTAGRLHFLFFSGNGNIHKGLDLLLEAFASTDLHLHICQNIDGDFSEVYRRELTECRNIHVYGNLPMRSVQFESLAVLCNWTITATCAEGQPGAIIECMGYGLIPVLPKNANISIKGFGISLYECTPQAIRESILKAAQMDAEECRKRSFMTMTEVQEEYSPERFRRNFSSAVQRIVALSRIDRLKDIPNE